jgi:hypothetical protein
MKKLTFYMSLSGKRNYDKGLTFLASSDRVFDNDIKFTINITDVLYDSYSIEFDCELYEVTNIDSIKLIK